MKNIAIIVAGGSGMRFGGEIPKQFIEVGGKPIIIHSMEAFDRHAEIGNIIAVCQPGHMRLLRRQTEEYGIRKLLTIAEAGLTRRKSVLSGLKAVNDKDAIVLIHDAARPLVSERIISDNIIAATECGAAVTAITAVDTMFISQDGTYAEGPLQRGGLYCAQTPQSFRFKIIMDAHISAGSADVTDDCQLVLAAGHKVAIVEGSELNFKVTTPVDLDRFRSVLGIQ